MWGSAIVGAAFVAIGGLLLLDGAGWLDLPGAVVPALLLIGFGFAAMAGAARR